MNSKQLRQTFFDFFKSKEHEIVSSSPMVVKNDPTLMFTNAGMNQFKDIFLGNQKPLSKRVANTQKCLRVSGKHNDLEEVGRDTYHHTMFEMLGNWSFGDYFKKEAIEWSWEFLTMVLNIPADRIYATVFEGNPEENVSRDNEAADVWEKCWDDTDNRIINGSKKDNFWEMGDTGPCGPCSELHIDLRDDNERKLTPGHTLVNKDHPLVIEVWNLVFIQFNRKSDGSLEPLPEKHVDTGMGLERLCMVTQGKTSNYDTDVFQTIIKKISTLTGFKYGSHTENDIAMRVIADHLRAVSFSIADGQMPSNNKAGYVIRRILRRAIRYSYTYLSQSEPFIYKLLPSLIETMGGSFPELEKQEDHIAHVIQQEEKTFLNTLGKGIKLIEKRIELIKDSKLTAFSGVDAFTLYDTYGFPLDLTELILQESNLEVDLNEFNKEMNKQKARSKADASKEMDDWVVLSRDTSFEFTGYNTTEDNIKITRYRKVNIKGKTQYHLVFNRSPFYAESGGQVGDTGEISSVNGKVAIINTIKENNLSLHITSSLPANPEDEFKALVNRSKRHHTTYNHSATHLLHHALRKVLGDHIEQKGSLVNHEKLRFDFSHFQKVTTEELDEIEKVVNNIIREDRQSEVFDDMPMKEAQEKGALALFGEKYGDKVRVISFGDSIELCGGTHVRSTGNIGLFKIVSEGAIAAGIRRIEAVTSSNAFDYLNSKLKLVEKIADILGVNSDFPETISRLMEENQSFRKEFQKVEAAAAAAVKAELMARSEYVNDILIVTGVIKASSVDMMKMVAQKARESGEILVFGIGAEIKGKANLVVMVSKELFEERKVSAAEIIKEISPEISGGGGGQSFLATAGGKNPQGIESALQKLKDFIKQKY